MALQSISGQFLQTTGVVPNSQPVPPWVAYDGYTAGAGGGGRTSGMTVGANAPLAVPLGSRFSIVSWSLQAVLGLQPYTGLMTGNVVGPHGRLGDVYGGLCIGAPPSAQIYSQSQMPGDTTLIEKLFDGATDDAPPWATSPGGTLTAAGLPYTASQQLPEPISIRSGEQLSFGAWMLPGVAPTIPTCRFWLSLMSLAWALYYDDGQDG